MWTAVWVCVVAPAGPGPGPSPSLGVSWKRFPARKRSQTRPSDSNFALGPSSVVAEHIPPPSLLPELLDPWPPPWPSGSPNSLPQVSAFFSLSLSSCPGGGGRPLPGLLTTTSSLFLGQVILFILCLRPFQHRPQRITHAIFLSALF